MMRVTSRPQEAMVVWEQILSTARQNVNEQTYITWFAQTEFLGIDGDCLHIQGPNQFFVDWLTEHHLDVLRHAACVVLEREIDVQVHVNPNPPAASKFDPRALVAHTMPEESDRRPPRAPQDVGLNPKYVFQDFVVGDNNRLANAACQAVADRPAEAYNPLFLYGGVGLGKTHLMQATGNRVLQKNPRCVVHYVSAENFMNELIQSIRDRKTFEFKNRYRNVDLLLIDDIQFLAGKESTQQEFFHTFNALYDANKQIVVTSDRPPKEIPTLEERLRSRFEWGLITDLQPPNFETRMAILKKKVEKDDIFIPDDVLVLIAESVQSNIRELEGALIRLLAFASLTNCDINVDMARECLGSLTMTHHKKEISLADVIKVVSAYYAISLDVLRSKLRTKPVAHARQVAMYICREHTGASLAQIGRKFGDRDHTTVHHAWQKMARLREEDPIARGEMRDILRNLLGE
jgi:chromosomal replication initiator protein